MQTQMPKRGERCPRALDNSPPLCRLLGIGTRKSTGHRAGPLHKDTCQPWSQPPPAGTLSERWDMRCQNHTQH